MSYFRTILILCLIILPIYPINAQIKLGSKTFPKIGTNYIFAKVKLYPEKKIQINDLGAEEWDISTFNPTVFDTIRLKKPRKTKYWRRFPDAQIALVSSPVEIEYLRLDSGKVYQTGLIGDFMEVKIPVLLKFKDKFLYRNNETRLNLIYADTTISKFVSPYFHKPGTDSIRADITYRYEARIDAEGYLKTPLGKYKTLREVVFVHKRVRGYKYSVFGWTPAPEYSLNKNFTIYRWYSADNGLQLAEANINKHDYIENIRYQYDSPMRLAFSARHVSCKGGNNGFVDLIVSGGIPDYKYEWSNGNVSENLINVKAGTYNVTVTDNKGRKLSAIYTVTEPLVALYALFNVKNVSCRGASDGSVSLEINGGKEPYDFIWSNDSINFELRNLRPGTYRVWVKDAGTCVITDSVEITQPKMKLRASIEKKHVSCYNGSDGKLTAIAEGGTPPYHFEWSNKDTSYAATGLRAGTYSVLVTDANGCTYKTEGLIKQPGTALVLTKNIKPVSCYGGSNGAIELNVEGGKPGYAYYWSDGSNNKNLRGIPTGYYQINITDNNECTIKDSIFVRQPEKPILIAHGKKDISCFGETDGSIIVNVSGGTPGYSYNWTNGMTKNSLKKLPKGIYEVKITDKNKCTAYDTVEIIGPDKALFIDFEKKDVICTSGNSGEIKLFIEGGTPDYSATWANKKTGTELKGLRAGKYSVMVTDNHNCKLKKDIIITEPKEALLIKFEKIDIECYNEKSGSIYITAHGGIPGYTYEWSNDEHAQNLIGLGAGKYTVTVTDNNQCERIEIIELKQSNELKLKAYITPTEHEKTIGEITINITGGTKPYSILWDEGQTTEKITNLRKGIHEVTITDSKDCQLVKKFEVGEK
ncbi:MAG: SprB repeat-containing protein [Bacteroidota bacterium]